jgi:hypothetical protein
MSEPEPFVPFVLRCECGAELQVHGKAIIGARTGDESVKCPKCGKEQHVPTQPLRCVLCEVGRIPLA